MMLLLNIRLNRVSHIILLTVNLQTVFLIYVNLNVLFSFTAKKTKIKHYLQISLRDKSGLGD